MRIQTRSSSKHLTFAAHTPHAISAESVVRSTQMPDLGACADRVEERRGSRRRYRIDHGEAPLRRRLAQDEPAQGPGGPCRAPPLCRLPPSFETRAALPLERLLRSDSDLDSGVATMCAVATVKVRVRSEHHSAVDAVPRLDRRSRDATCEKKFLSDPLLPGARAGATSS